MIIGNEESLPKSWCLSLISDFVEINPTINKAEISDDLEVSFIPMASVQAENGNIDASGVRKFSEVKKGYTPFVEGDVLFAKITPCMENGKMAIAPALKNNIGFGSTEFHVLRCFTGISPQYLYYYVSSKPFKKLAEHYMTGAVGQKRVTAPYLSNCKIPIPPTNEQHRIVAKIEALFSELDKGVESFKTAREQLKIYRQALLKHAFSGKLTEQWRAEHAGKLESAETLLQRIQAERQQRYQQQLKDWEDKSHSIPLLQRGKRAANQQLCTASTTIPPFEKGGTGGISKPKPPKTLPPLTTEELAELPELPEGWVYSRLGALIDEPTYGTAKKCDYDTDGIGVLRIPNVVSGRIDASDMKFAQFEKNELDSYKLDAGDILLIRSNGSISIVGRCALVSEYDINYLYAGYLIKLRPNESLIAPAFLINQISAHSLRKQIEAKAKSTSGVNNINLIWLH